MASILSAGTTSATALNMSADTSGVLQLASNNGVVGLTLNTSQQFLIGIGSGTPAASAKVKIETGSRNVAFFDMTATGGENWIINSTNTSGSTDVLGIYAYGSAGLYISDVGNVGVVVSNPQATLDVTKNQNALTALNVFNNDSTNASSIASIRVGYDSTYHYSISRLGNSADIIQNATQSSANIIYQIGSSEKMRIASTGKLFLGNNASVGNGGLLEVDATNQGSNYNGINVRGGTSSYAGVFWSTPGNFCYFTINGAGSNGTITWNGSNTVYATTSDQRLKENIVDASSALSKINSVKIRSFNWIENKKEVDFGVIAQELVEVAPEAVYVPKKEEENWGVDTAVLVPLMIKAIQELNAKVTALENK